MKRVIYSVSNEIETGHSSLGNAIAYVERLISKTAGTIVINRRNERVSLFAAASGIELTFYRENGTDTEYARLRETLFDIWRLRHGTRDESNLVTVGDVPEDVVCVAIDSPPPPTDDAVWNTAHDTQVILPELDEEWTHVQIPQRRPSSPHASASA